ncbi:hypothetical protein TYRP_000691 [Tyrophagus putrescentiae]|nr:hypothetical protein TYRP_000691 [Tyrophagus putrescentiae]
MDRFTVSSFLLTFFLLSLSLATCEPPANASPSCKCCGQPSGRYCGRTLTAACGLSPGDCSDNAIYTCFSTYSWSVKANFCPGDLWGHGGSGCVQAALGSARCE